MRCVHTPSSPATVVVTDTIPLKRGSSKIEVLSISELVADVIESVVDHTSIAPHFEIGNI